MCTLVWTYPERPGTRVGKAFLVPLPCLVSFEIMTRTAQGYHLKPAELGAKAEKTSLALIFSPVCLDITTGQHSKPAGLGTMVVGIFLALTPSS